MFGRRIEAPPTRVSGTSVLARLVDGLAFRYYWATEGLRPADYDFRPGPDSMSTPELQEHTLHLVFMIKQTVFNADERERFESDDPASLRAQALESLRLVREHLIELDDETVSGHEVLKRDGSRRRAMPSR